MLPTDRPRLVQEYGRENQSQQSRGTCGQDVVEARAKPGRFGRQMEARSASHRKSQPHLLRLGQIFVGSQSPQHLRNSCMLNLGGRLNFKILGLIQSN